MVQTGFKAEAHCWKCFKENSDMSLLDGKAVNLCKGCLYVVKQFSQWLNAYGLGIRQIMIAAVNKDELSVGENQGKRGSRGRKGSSVNEKTPEEGGGDPLVAEQGEDST